MIYPTRRAVLLMVLGAVVALAVAALFAARWYLALAWPIGLAMLIALDAWRTRGPLAIEVALPASAYVGEVREAELALRIGSGPARAEVALARSLLITQADDGRMTIPLAGGTGTAKHALTMLRRGRALFDRLWLRWSGPLGLVWRQRELPRGDSLHILPDLRPTHRHGIRLFERYAAEGALKQLLRGEGSDFDALVEFRAGMDRRSIDWKSSARATKLLARQYHGEKNNQIVFALDCGRQMAEPVGGIARLDRVISAALLTGWLALRFGDRVALHAFDSKPRLTSGLVSGAGAFAELQRLAASIDYGDDETNYTYALTELNARLSRRSLVILFTEVTDRISARFLLTSIRLLIRKHLVLVVMLRDDELAGFAEADPVDADDVTRAITAASLLKERQEVVAKLRQLGIDVLETPFGDVAPQIAEAYLRIKRRDRL
ncbi:DUF58 domain-containing protein [Sphingomonas sp. KRR8]|uniref:DUF58 domain-containing protein n=1 Tax=Sphingomonas sp. KRR8 TaxID=2942996 RepID=UPI0020224D14|nr:DUF58 domain-containing protein [Sphingomonas sp. KRR8]URD60866.1 DUF58 domain-containing protein [Sphingomonas sp. KRR8]